MGKRVMRRVAATASATTRQRADNEHVDRTVGVSRLGAIGKESVLSRGKRKRTEKRARVERKQDFIDTELRRLEAEAASRRTALASKTAKRQEKGSLTGMKVLSDALAGSSAAIVRADGETLAKGKPAGAERPVQKMVHEKARRQILADESVQVKNVFEHPSYQADPMDALRQHLMNIVGQDPLAVPEALAPVEMQKQKRKMREERKSLANASRAKAVGGGKKSVSRDTSTRRREEKAALAAKARSVRIKKNAKSVQRVEAMGRIGVPRPKLTGRQ
jgi:Ribosome biogenesis protein SLX9